MKTETVALRIQYDERVHDAPNKWDWPDLLDIEPHSIELAGSVPDSDEVSTALATLFARINDINDNWERGDLAGAVNELNDQRAYTEALLVRVGLLTGKKGN
jgi:hypothetical protein